MTTALRARIAVVAALGAATVALAACTTDGVATVDSAELSATSTSTTTSWAIPTPTTDAPVSEVPAPAGWQTMTCKQYSELSLSEQVAVIKANGNQAPAEALSTAAQLLSTGCAAFPDLLISDALAGRLPR
ncbi:hypothetical protein nbrc107696_16310 [Gordonia spumicola]|uniref:Lipoprotein n=1 Tax=Gordonia spumicola TaxID=589161 RepID=A0A7I9V729_9ACTN|nr:hypothetical protein [Gordonia spumicola]GEE01185.1 hypothetical protein nbrc107696_16310 [Gordonia spumicola]